MWDEDIVHTISNNRDTRCRLITSWRWRSFQGLGCSPIKVVRELGSDRQKRIQNIENTRRLSVVIQIEKSTHIGETLS